MDKSHYRSSNHHQSDSRSRKRSSSSERSRSRRRSEKSRFDDYKKYDKQEDKRSSKWDKDDYKKYEEYQPKEQSSYQDRPRENTYYNKPREGFQDKPRETGRQFEPQQFGKDLQTINWQNERLVPFQKDFYREHPDIANRSSREVKDFREKYEISVSTHSNIETPKPIIHFKEAGFPSSILQLITKSGYEKPTPIQAQSWPIALKGYDLISIAETGSGKTLAFTLPAIVHLQAQGSLNYGDGPIVLILAPTRELAMQIQEQVSKFGETQRIRTTCLYGGVDKYPQRKELQKGCHIVIATPGRLIDFLEDKTTNLRRVTFLVLDEADRMLDMGFEPQIRKIVSQIRPDRQTLMWSATWPNQIQQLARDLCKENPIKIRVGSEDLSANRKIEQKFEFVEDQYKKSKLESILRDIGNDSKIIIFCQTKKSCDYLGRQLSFDGYKAIVLHGNKSQAERDSVMELYKGSRFNILVATDIAARGLDVKDIKYVINFDFPNQIEDYIHRIGRTGRAGAIGVAYTFLTPENSRFAADLIEMLEESEQEVPQKLKEICSNFRPRTKAPRPQYQGNNRQYDNNSNGNTYNNNNQSKQYSNNNSSNKWGGPQQQQHQPQQQQQYQNNNYQKQNYSTGYQQRPELTQVVQDGAPKFGYYNTFIDSGNGANAYNFDAVSSAEMMNLAATNYMLMTGQQWQGNNTYYGNAYADYAKYYTNTTTDNVNNNNNNNTSSNNSNGNNVPLPVAPPPANTGFNRNGNENDTTKQYQMNH